MLAVAAVAAVLAGGTWFVQNHVSQSPQLMALALEDEVLVCLGERRVVMWDRCTGEVDWVAVAPLAEGPLLWRTGRASTEYYSEVGGDAGTRLVGQRFTAALPDKASVHLLNRADEALKRRLIAAVPGSRGDVDRTIVDVAFETDLDGDGQSEIVFVMSDLKAAVEENEAKELAVPFQIVGGILHAGQTRNALLFYLVRGTYVGGTDSIWYPTIVGLARLGAGTPDLYIVLEDRAVASEVSLVRRDGTKLMVKRLDS